MKKQKIKFRINTSEIKTRVTWGFNPVTRTIKSKKVYSRKNYKISY
ncbi:MAG: hypothetical protein U9Q30_04810 [Campylobacterota bacterium]|nr:hypothetical protein [Campylobacterota bacterium]